ncbi:MAG: GntR family transcriptional regulator [Actinobacteria bacterium]|nr:GntR family transcriptional regulator [Cyanobacteriota bacterium]MCL5770809.1 GntR family transcriptional regulator [Actinomycetota bacterium]
MKDNVELYSNFKIDKNSRIPYYFQLKQHIIEEIESGHWKPGQQVIPEIKICELFDISRTVTRQAYQELVNEGYLVKKKAKGTFVAEPKISENLVQSLRGFFEDMTARGYNVKNDVLYQEKIKPTKKIGENLNLKLDEDVIAIYRLRKLNDEPIVLDRTYLPFKLCPDLLKEDLTNKSLYSFIEGKYNLKIDRGRKFIEATIAKDEEAKLLNIKKGSPLLFIESVSYLTGNIPIEYYVALHRADRIKLVTDLKRTQAFNEIGNIPANSTTSGILIKD